MSKERPAGEPVQDLRQRGVHALSLPGGEYDHGQLHGADSSTGVPANSLKSHQKLL
jgi:hypothetical protein